MRPHYRPALERWVHELQASREALLFDLLAFARQQMEMWMIDLARQARADYVGGNQVEVQMVRQDQTVQGGGNEGVASRR
jgi:cyclopropane fatty-acyl-phospholipid synthase-like methyltransferase